MPIQIVFETHALSEDNERGIATGWLAGRLSAPRWAGQRVMIIGHLATYRALEHVVHHATLEDLLAADFTWRAHGWDYLLG